MNYSHTNHIFNFKQFVTECGPHWWYYFALWFRNNIFCAVAFLLRSLPRPRGPKTVKEIRSRPHLNTLYFAHKIWSFLENLRTSIFNKIWRSSSFLVDIINPFPHLRHLLPHHLINIRRQLNTIASQELDLMQIAHQFAFSALIVNSLYPCRKRINTANIFRVKWNLSLNEGFRYMLDYKSNLLWLQPRSVMDFI